MAKLNVPLKPLPEQPGERRIPVHWFFPLMALFYLAGGLACLRGSAHAHSPGTLLFVGWCCIALGLFGLLTFVVCVLQLQRGKTVEGLFTIRVRPLILGGCMAVYMAIFFIISRHLPGYFVMLLPFIWVFSAAWIWNRIVRYFQNHPPKR